MKMQKTNNLFQAFMDMWDAYFAAFEDSVKTLAFAAWQTIKIFFKLVGWLIICMTMSLVSVLVFPFALIADVLIKPTPRDPTITKFN